MNEATGGGQRMGRTFMGQRLSSSYLLQRGAIYLASLAVVAGAHGGVAQANPDRAFTAANYPVFATAKDAVAAKRSALKDGQQAALRSVLKR
ncbi:MAG: hypothetical protein AAFO75_01430, partial [Pseudomonadota bacterium]